MKKFFHKNKIIIVLGLIVIIAAFFRFWCLTQNPLGFSADEATIGYNAYSILKTGADEYGIRFPLAFKAFSDYQAPLYTYLTVPSIAVLGLNEFAVRLPSAVFGILTVITVYFLCLEIFKNSTIGLSAAFLLAISPFHVFFSRGAWQANLATFLITLGFYLFAIGLRSGKYLPLSVLAFLASLYSYQSPRLVVPIIGISLVLLYWKVLWKKKKALFASFVLGLIFFIPILFMLSSTAGQARFKGVSVFSDLGPVNQINSLRGEHSNPNGVVALIFHNKVQTFSIIVAENYLKHFSPDFLFFTGDSVGRQNIPGMGVLYLFDVLLLPAGLALMVKKEWFSKSKVILIWLIFAPLASAFTFQTPNALRAANMSVPLAIVSGFGAYSFFEFISSKRFLVKLLSFLLVLAVGLFFVLRFLNLYFVHLPQKYGLEWEYGFNEMISYINQNKEKHQKIIITNRYDQPYILTLFYLKYDPKTYQSISKQETLIDKFGFTTISSFDNFEFRHIDWANDSKLKNVIIVGTAEEIPDKVPTAKEIRFPNGKVAFKIVEG